MDRRVWAVAALGAAARLPGLVGGRPLWLDEAMAALAAREAAPWPALAHVDLHPPVWALLHGALPASAFALRASSWVCGALTVPAAWWAARRHAGDDVALRFAVFAALCPPWVQYAGEARPYAAGLLLATWWLGVVAAPGPWLAVVGALGAATQYGLWVVGATTAPWRRPGGAWALGGVGVALALLPTLLTQLRGPGRALTSGALAAGVPDAAALPAALVGALGWLVTGRAGLVGMSAGVVVVLVLVGARPVVRVDRLWGAPLLLFTALALLGLHPLGPARQLLVVGPALGLGLCARLEGRRAALGVAALLAATARQPPLPWHDVVCAATGADLPLVADAGAGPSLAVAGLPVEALPWDADLARARLRALPGPVWLVRTPFPETAGLGDGGPVVRTCDGAWAVRWDAAAGLGAP